MFFQPSGSGSEKQNPCVSWGPSVSRSPQILRRTNGFAKLNRAVPGLDRPAPQVVQCLRKTSRTSRPLPWVGKLVGNGPGPKSCSVTPFGKPSPAFQICRVRINSPISQALPEIFAGFSLISKSRFFWAISGDNFRTASRASTPSGVRNWYQRASAVRLQAGGGPRATAYSADRRGSQRCKPSAP